MSIRNYDEWYEELDDYRFDLSDQCIYNAGVKAATDHYEEEKAAIHEYYTAKWADLLGTKVYIGSSENGGKMT